MGEPSSFLDPGAFREVVRDGRLEVLGEVTAQYEGYSPSDAVYAPYWAIAQEYGIPVGIHTGGQYHAQALALMDMYPQVHADISVLNWMPGWVGESLEAFLRGAQRRGLLDRVMFGSDQMVWPEAIGIAIDRVNSYDFLTLDEKRGIFYDNAARFLGLSDEVIRAHAVEATR